MKAILIDVTAYTVTDVEIDGANSLRAMYKAIGCSCVTRIVLDKRNDLWIDDEALMIEPQPNKFSIGSYARPLAGNALICGYTRQGTTVATTLTAEQARPLITFYGDIELTIEPSIVYSF